MADTSIFRNAEHMHKVGGEYVTESQPGTWHVDIEGMIRDGVDDSIIDMFTDFFGISRVTASRGLFGVTVESTDDI